MKGVKGKGEGKAPQSHNCANTFAVHCAHHRVATSSCRGHVNELATEPFLLLHREHGTGYWRSWNCCNRRTRFIVIWKHFCFILSTGARIRIDSVMHPQSSSRGCNTSASLTATVTKRQKYRSFGEQMWLSSICLNVLQIG